MSKKPSRRRKASPRKRRCKTFTIIVEAQPMLVSYEPDDMVPGYANFEFRSPYEPPRRIPVSETGFRSEFVSMNDVKAARSPQDFARNLVVSLLNSRASRPADPRQLGLFR
jgi:hypothetical protein